MAGSFIKVDIYDRALTEALKRLETEVGDLKPALMDAGEKLLKNTRDRWEKLQTGASVDGVRWSPLSEKTTLKRKKQNRDKILVETGKLRNSIAYQVEGDTLLFGTNDIRAAAHQFGMKQGYAGRTKRGGPIPWGDIPERPFLLVSRDDENDILEIFADHLSRSLGGS